MNSSKTVTMITITALIMLLIVPIQSIPTRHKRWTFNTWRLRGQRHMPQAPLNPTTESYSPTISTDIEHQDQPINVKNYDDDESYKMLSQLLQLFQVLDQEHKEKDNGNN